MYIESLVTMTVWSSCGLMRIWLNEYGALPPATLTSVTLRHVLPPSSVRYSSLPMMPGGERAGRAHVARRPAPGFGFWFSSSA